jgi:hypothetical protein
MKNAVGFSLSKDYSQFALPRGLTVGISTHRSGMTWSLDSEYIFGTFGGVAEHRASIWLLRAGIEKRLRAPFVVRAGLIYPAIARTSSLGDMTEDIPTPRIGGALGLGADFNWGNVDIAVYGDPARSYFEQEIAVNVEASLTVKF